MTTTTAAPVFDITVSRVVPADPDTVWTFLTDVTRFGELSPENVESHWLGEARGIGAQFKGSNKLSWARWSNTATVTDWEPGHRFGFFTSAPSETQWNYELEPVDGGTRVTESMLKANRQPLPIRVVNRLVGVTDRPARVREGMETTLQRLEGAVA